MNLNFIKSRKISPPRYARRPSLPKRLIYKMMVLVLSAEIRAPGKMMPAKLSGSVADAETSVFLPDKIDGQPCCCGSVAVPNFAINQSRTSGWAQASRSKLVLGDIRKM